MAAKTATVSEEKIREIAHQLWVEAGKPEGQAEDHWFKAIGLASAKAAKKVGAKAAAKPVVAKPAAVKKAPAKVAAPAKVVAPAKAQAKSAPKAAAKKK